MYKFLFILITCVCSFKGLAQEKQSKFLNDSLIKAYENQILKFDEKGWLNTPNGQKYKISLNDRNLFLKTPIGLNLFDNYRKETKTGNLMVYGGFILCISSIVFVATSDNTSSSPSRVAQGLIGTGAAINVIGFIKLLKALPKMTKAIDERNLQINH